MTMPTNISIDHRRLIRVAALLCLALVAQGCTAGGSPSGELVEDSVTKDKTSVSEEPVTVRDKLSNAQPAQVGSISFDGTHVLATVVSTGCTSHEHFEVLSQTNATSCQVTLMRNKPDFCRRAPVAVDIAIAWEMPANCDSDTLVFTNPVIDMGRAAGKSEPARKLK